jgi:hypothetical protein
LLQTIELPSYAYAYNSGYSKFVREGKDQDWQLSIFLSEFDSHLGALAIKYSAESQQILHRPQYLSRKYMRRTRANPHHITRATLKVGIPLFLKLEFAFLLSSWGHPVGRTFSRRIYVNVAVFGFIIVNEA